MKRINGLVMAAVVLLGTFILWGIWQRGDITYATAVGTVRTGKELKVRTGPGEQYDYVKQGGADAVLANDTQVTILAESKKWFKIHFMQGSTGKIGYVQSKYLSVMSGDVLTQVTGKISPSPVLVRTRAVGSGSLLRNNGTAVRLVTGKKLRIISESVVYGVKYYRISFTYRNKKRAGFVPAKSVEADYAAAMPGVITTSGQAGLKKDFKSQSVVQGEGGPVYLKSGTPVLMLGEETSSGVKYIHIDVVVNDHVYQGYVASNLVRFQQVDVEEIVKGEQPKFIELEDEEASPTPEPSSVGIAVNDKDKSGASGSGSGKTAALSDKNFKKQLVSEGFPSSYMDALMALHEKYPKWQFTVYQTGIDWSTAVDNESVVGLNLIPNSKPDAWKSREEGAYDASTGKYIPFDGSTWVTASEMAVRYYMDPRNFLDEKYIFQFESLEYQEGVQNRSGVENVLHNTPMYQTEYTYTDDLGKESSVSYSQTFMDAAISSGVSPYHLASRVKQEVVTGPDSMSSSVSGTVKGYEGIYNYYNIGANNSTKPGGAVANGLSWAKSDTTYLRPWDSPYRSIVGGAQYLGTNYIKAGQNTLYLQKFNVTGTNTYDHQYMGNIEAPASEALKTVEAYGADIANMNLVFSIPVYTGMPTEVSPVPSSVEEAEEESANNYLKTLRVKGYRFTTPFRSGDDGSRTYRLTVKKKIKSIRIQAVPADSSAQVTGTGNKKLKIGTRIFSIKVKAENGNIRKYKVKVTRKKK